MLNLETTLDYLKDRWMDVQLQIVELENIKAKVIKYEDMGLKTKFFIKGDELIFRAYRRKPIGFNSLANEEKPAQPVQKEECQCGEMATHICSASGCKEPLCNNCSCPHGS